MNVQQRISSIALVVREYDEAVSYFRERLQFELIEDIEIGGGKRWVVVAPRGGGARLVLARAANPAQEVHIGDQTGGRVFLFLETDDFWRDYHAYRALGVEFTEEPREEEYGTVVVFKDLYGNKWDLIQRAPRTRTTRTTRPRGSG